MNRVTLIVLFSLFTLLVTGQNYKPVDEGSKVHFSIKNFGINTGGDLYGIRGSISFDPSRVSAADFSVSVDVKTINTESKKRDEHLTGEGYFDADKYPVILIKSEKINAFNNGSYTFTGLLTMHGVTKSISFPFTATPQGSDYLFSGDFEINRLDYSIGKPSAIMSDKVKVSLSVLAKKS